MAEQEKVHKPAERRTFVRKSQRFKSGVSGGDLEISVEVTFRKNARTKINMEGKRRASIHRAG